MLKNTIKLPSGRELVLEGEDADLTGRTVIRRSYAPEELEWFSFHRQVGESDQKMFAREVSRCRHNLIAGDYDGPTAAVDALEFVFQGYDGHRIILHRELYDTEKT